MTGNGQRATLRTIADMTGLSLSTVSLSLRGGGNLREETNDRIARAAESVGYIPNRAGVRLRTGKTNVIVLVLDGAEDAINFARQLIKGIGDSIRGSRYHLTVMPEFDRNASVETIRYILDNRIADGIIITHTAPRDPRVQLLTEADFPFVTHGRTEFFTPHAFHDYDSENFTRIAVERLVALGSRNLMTLIGHDLTFNYHNIVTSFRRSIQAAGVEGRIIGDDVVKRSSARAMRAFGTQLAQSPDRPDGILCDGEVPAMALASGLRAGGVEIGRDIRMVCKQTSDLLPTLFPEIESIEENVYDAGRELTRLLLERISGTRPELLQTLAEPVVHFRTDGIKHLVNP